MFVFPKDLDASFQSSAGGEGLVQNCTGIIDVNAFLAQLRKTWVSPDASSSKPKHIFLADWTANQWNYNELQVVKQLLKKIT